jgi:hypothetical protein
MVHDSTSTMSCGTVRTWSWIIGKGDQLADTYDIKLRF